MICLAITVGIAEIALFEAVTVMGTLAEPRSEFTVIDPTCVPSANQIGLMTTVVSAGVSPPAEFRSIHGVFVVKVALTG